MDSNHQQTAAERALAVTDVQAVLHRYAFMARDKVNFEDMATRCFWPDALFRLPDGTILKTEEIGKVVQGDEAKYIRHHLTTINIEFPNEIEARTTSQFFAITDQSRCDHWGEWQDVLRRNEAGVWLIKDKTIVLDGVDPNGWAAAKYGASAKAS